MRTLRIKLFGSLTIYLDEELLFAGIPHTKPLELFAYLLVHRDCPQPREALATLLWPELPGAQAKKNLRQVLCSLQHLLTDTIRPDTPPVFLIEHNWIGLNPSQELQLDVATFEQAYPLAWQPVDTSLDCQGTRMLTAAAALYRGELLSGLYADWCLYERERLENMYLEICHRLLVDAEHRQAYGQAIQHALAILQHDRANERAHRDLMRLYYLSGNRSAALRQYGNCVANLARELGVKPRGCTEQLYRQICQDELVPAAAHATAAAEQLAGNVESQHFSNLQRIRSELRQVLQQVETEIQQIERLLQH